MPPAVQVKGLRELQAAFAHADRATRLGLRAELQHVAEPVQRDAQALAGQEISGMRRSPRWARMRVGVTRRLVYVAPKQRGVKTRNPRDPRRRPNLAPLLMARAMEPVLERHETEIVIATEAMLDHIADGFNQGGPT
jgi:hypothetical protein